MDSNYNTLLDIMVIRLYVTIKIYTSIEKPDILEQLDFSREFATIRNAK